MPRSPLTDFNKKKAMAAIEAMNKQTLELLEYVNEFDFDLHGAMISFRHNVDELENKSFYSCRR